MPKPEMWFFQQMVISVWRVPPPSKRLLLQQLIIFLVRILPGKQLWVIRAPFSANGTLNGDIIITGGGDPALGSDRYDQKLPDRN